MQVIVGLTRWWRRGRRERRSRSASRVAELTGGVVRRGPFAGLVYPSAAAAGSALAPKLLGTYELEVHAWLEAAIGRGPDRVLNLGAGEGYYAVGLARRLPLAGVHAFDPDDRARELCAALAEANGVSDRVHLHGACELADLRALCDLPALIVCDVEGAERHLLRPREVPGLARCEVIVEVHGRGTRGEIADRFTSTHSVAAVRSRRRLARDAAGVVEMDASALRLAMDERRRLGLEWLHLVPHG